MVVSVQLDSSTLSTYSWSILIESRLQEIIRNQAVVYHLDIGEEEEDSDDEANEDHHTRLGQDFLQTGRQVEDWTYKALVTVLQIRDIVIQIRIRGSIPLD